MPSPDAPDGPVLATGPLQRRLRLFELLALLGAALFAIWFHATLPGKLPTEEHHRAAAQVLSAESRPGDVVLLYPWWTERARLFAPDGLPVVGYQGSDADSLWDHPRIWVLAQPDLPRSELQAFAEQFSPGRTQTGPVRRFGPLALTLYENGRYRPPVFSATDELSSARVYLESPDGRRADCSWDGRQHHCSGGIGVSASWHEVMFKPLRCVLLRAPGGPNRLVVEFADVPASAQLMLEAGLIWDRPSRHGPEYSPAQVVVDDGAGRSLLDLTLPLGVEQGFFTESAIPRPSSSTLRLWVQADKAREREVCAVLTAREARR